MKDNLRKERIKEIYKLVEDLNSELDILQETCKHSNYKLGKYSWRIGNIDIRRICNVCGDVLPTYPTTEEYNEFIKENNRGQGIKIYKNN